MQLGKITGVDGSSAYVQLSSEATPRQLPILTPKGLMAQIGDMVLCAQIGGKWMIVQIYEKE